MIGGIPPDENYVAIFRCLSMTWHEARLSRKLSLYINNFKQNSVACPSRRFPTKSIVNLPKVAVTLGNFSCNFSRNFVATQVALKLFKCNIPRQELVSQVFVGTSVETPLFVQLQCYAFKRCKMTSCTKKCLVQQRLNPRFTKLSRRNMTFYS